MLTNALIQNTKPSTKAVRLYDGRGLYLEIGQTGTRWWRFKYRFGGKEKRISLGVFPDISLKIARERREKKGPLRGTDPLDAK